jgi:hypothetical protein
LSQMTQYLSETNPKNPIFRCAEALDRYPP